MPSALAVLQSWGHRAIALHLERLLSGTPHIPQRIPIVLVSRFQPLADFEGAAQCARFRRFSAVGCRIRYGLVGGGPEYFETPRRQRHAHGMCRHCDCRIACVDVPSTIKRVDIW